MHESRIEELKDDYKQASCSCIWLFVIIIVLIISLCEKNERIHELETELARPVQVQNIEQTQTEEPQTEEPQKETPKYKSLGMFTATAYCNENRPHICNNGNPTTTATGTTPTPGRTIAVDPKVIPLGSEVVINGHTYIAEDTGGEIKGKKIDILLSSHEEALKFGRQQVEVFVEY